MAKKKLTSDKTLAPRIQAALERGLTVDMTCALVGISKETYFKYVREIPDFSDLVFAAQQTAHIKAVEVLRSGLEGQKENHVEIDEFTETRTKKGRDKDGNETVIPYNYVKKTTRKKVIERPASPMIAIEWLKRRDSINWSEKLYLEFELDIGKVLEWARLLKDFDLSAGDVMEKMLQKLHEQKAALNVDR